MAPPKVYKLLVFLSFEEKYFQSCKNKVFNLNFFRKRLFVVKLLSDFCGIIIVLTIW